MAYLSMDGKGYLAKASNGIPGKFRYVGPTASISYDLSVDEFEHEEKETGQRFTDLVMYRKKSGSISITLEDCDLKNLAMVSQSAVLKDASESITEEDLGVCAVGDFIRLKKTNVSAVVVRDAAATALTLGTHYSFTKSGLVQILSLANGATPLVQPLEADYLAGPTESVAMFTSQPEEYWFMFDGVDKITGDVMVTEFYRLSIPPKGFSLKADDLNTIEIEAKILADLTKADDAELGRFGRIVRALAE